MSGACGLDLLFAAAATTSGVDDDARASVQIQKMRRARGASETPRVRDATRASTGGLRRFKNGKGGAGLVDVTNGRVRSPKTPGVARASAKRGRNARRAPESESEDDDARVRVDEECVRGMEILANEHADVVIERVREWLDLLDGDARGGGEFRARGRDRRIGDVVSPRIRTNARNRARASGENAQTGK